MELGVKDLLAIIGEKQVQIEVLQGMLMKTTKERDELKAAGEKDKGGEQAKTGPMPVK